MKGTSMERLIKWRLGNKIKNETWEEIEKKKYSNDILKQAAFAPMPPLDQIHVPPSRYWVAKTNFIITNKIAKEIENTPGVNIMRPFGPYDFFVAVNEEFFNDSHVMSVINKKLKAKVKKNPTV